jgi:hypothetical protein
VLLFYPLCVWEEGIFEANGHSLAPGEGRTAATRPPGGPRVRGPRGHVRRRGSLGPMRYPRASPLCVPLVLADAWPVLGAKERGNEPTERGKCPPLYMRALNGIKLARAGVKFILSESERRRPCGLRVAVAGDRPGLGGF